MTENEVIYVTITGQYTINIPIAKFAQYMGLSEQTTLSLIEHNEITEISLPMHLVMEEL
jgi:hypothetical protein